MIASTYHLGIDVGSTTAKAVVFDPLAQRVLFSRYVRHNAHQVETVATLLRTVAKEFPECSFRLVACGSGGTTIAGVAELENRAFRAAAAQAVVAAYRRNEQLG